MSLRLAVTFASCVLLAGQSAVAASALVNPGFEAADPLAVWKTWIYHDGKAPVVRLDTQEAKGGRQSLLIEAGDPADVVLGQVAARDSTDTGGTIHVQTPEGATLARGPSTFGTSPWKEIQTAFRVPADGRAKIVLFFVGYGKGTGKVWFDDLRLERADGGGPETVRIFNEHLTRLPIDAKQGGQFIEPLCHLIPSLHAQQVANTSFEDDPPWKVAFNREIDRPHRPWYPDGAVHLASYAFDTNQPFNGRRSLRIELPTAHARAGISQDGFHLKAGLAYRLRLHLRSAGDVAVRATLHGGGGLAAESVSLGKAGCCLASRRGHAVRHALARKLYAHP